MLKSVAFIVTVTLAVLYYKVLDQIDDSVPSLPKTFWGPSDKKNQNDETIRPFSIDVPKEVIDDLNERLDKRRKYVPPLENTAWTYGVSSKYFEDVIDYWRNKYDWKKRQALLNKYPQFITTIQGLDIHFYHVKPTSSVINGKKLKVLPLLLVHGWPGSVVEFQKILPMLTTPRDNVDFVFEVVAPSLPGYGFSQGASRPGLGPAEMGVVLRNLMLRLGFNKFYTQGGDWGSLITAEIATVFPDNVLGSHMNMCAVRGFSSGLWMLIGTVAPSLVVPKEFANRLYPLKYHILRILEESGYMHLQATKPDTIGTALMESPSALAVYILEKFSTWTNPEYRFRNDGGLLDKYTMDELLDNVMIYWITDSITTSMRLYAEALGKNWGKHDKYSINVPTACAAFPHELTYTPESLVRSKHRNLIQFNHFNRGGHFAAFEEPKLLADDFWQFVQTATAPVPKK